MHDSLVGSGTRKVKVELGVERRSGAVRHPHGDRFIEDMVERLYRQPEKVSTTLASSEIFRLKRAKSSRISSRPS